MTGDTLIVSSTQSPIPPISILFHIKECQHSPIDMSLKLLLPLIYRWILRHAQGKKMDYILIALNY